MTVHQLAFRLLHALVHDAERAADLGKLALRTGFVPYVPLPQGSWPILLGKPVSTVLGVPAGLVKTAHPALIQALFFMGVGWVEIGGFTPHPRTGNPRPRFKRLGRNHLVNWFGFNNLGYQANADMLLEYRHRYGDGGLVGVNLANPGPDAPPASVYKTMAAEFALAADYIMVNRSCPNTGHGRAEQADLESLKADLGHTLEGAGTTPVGLKFGPVFLGNPAKADWFHQALEVARAAGVTLLAATNTTTRDETTKLVPWVKGRAPDPILTGWLRAPQDVEALRVRQGDHVGGYSGGNLYVPVTLPMTRFLARNAGGWATIMAGGGVSQPGQVTELREAGADAVWSFTGWTTQGPDILPPLLEAGRMAVPLPEVARE